MKKIVLSLLIICSSQQFIFSQCETAPVNMASWWTGDNNTIDSISDNDGTQLNGLNYTVGMVDNAFLFDGIDDMILVPHSASLDTTGDMTVMAWVRRIGYANPHQTVFCKGAGYVPNDEPTVFSMRFEFDITEFVFEDSNGNNVILNGPAFEDSMYHHYVYVRQGNTHTLYVDGFLFNNDTFTNPPASTTGLPFTIGAQYHNPTNSSNDYDFYFHGEIDELMLYNRALSNSEIQAVYNAGTDGVCKDALSIVKTNEQISLKFYPNPASSYIKFEIASPYIYSHEKLTLSIYDIKGATIKEVSMNSDSEIDISSLTTGTYIYTLKKFGKILKSGQILKK